MYSICSIFGVVFETTPSSKPNYVERYSNDPSRYEQFYDSANERKAKGYTGLCRITEMMKVQFSSTP